MVMPQNWWRLKTLTAHFQLYYCMQPLNILIPVVHRDQKKSNIVMFNIDAFIPVFLNVIVNQV